MIPWAEKTLQENVETLGHAPGKDDRARVLPMEQIAKPLPRFVNRLFHVVRPRVTAAINIAALFGNIAVNRVGDRLRFRKTRRRVVEVNSAHIDPLSTHDS